MRSFFCAFNITRDIKYFRQFLFYLKKFIWTKFLISPVLFTAQKRQTTFRKREENFVVVVLKIKHVQEGWQMNVTNIFEDQRRLLTRLSTLIFRGTRSVANCVIMSFLWIKDCIKIQAWRRKFYQWCISS